jgi:hypothetical protein
MSQADDERNKVCKIKRWRSNRADDAILSKILSDEGMTFQAFIDACTQSLLRADPNMLKVMKDFKMLLDIPKETIGEYVFSQRERTSLLEEFEKKGKL